MKCNRLLLATAFAALLSGCGPQAPIVIGFIGGLSDRNSDTGRSGQNGVVLAVEQFNRAGGINGRMIELISRDDAQNKETAAKSANELVEARVEAVIGPFTSSMAEVIVPITGKAGIFEISPTLTSMKFYGKDDNLFRINRTTRDNAKDYARVLARRGLQRTAVAFDTRNGNFSESWLAEFRAAVVEMGSEASVAVPYSSSAETDFAKVVRAMLDSKPDSLLFISGALDAARLAQQARKAAPALPVAASEWAATEQLIDLGGDVVEGLLIAQNFNRDDPSPRFRDFNDAYYKRFQRPPDYSSVSAYDAAIVVLSAMKQRHEGEAMKAAVLKYGPYDGLQQQINFDANGDTLRKVFFTEIRAGRYVRVD